MTDEQRDAVLKRQWNRMLELGANIYFTAKLGATDGLSFQQVAAIMTGNTQDDYADMMLEGRPQPRRQPLQVRMGEQEVMARIVAGIATSHVPAIGAAHRPRQDRGALLGARVLGLRGVEEVDRQGEAGRLHRRLQRPCLRVLRRADPDVRARLRGGVPARRRRLGPAPRAGRAGPPQARHPHRAVGDPRRVRSHHLQQDGGRPRPDGAAQPAVRQGRQVAVPDHSAGRQRRAVPPADRQPLLQSRQGDPQGGRELSGRPEGR